MQTVAFLGMGVMGSAMAANLAQGGYRVYVWNRTPQRAAIKRATERGAIWCDSIAAAVHKAEVVFICVGEGADVEQVLFPHVVDHLSAGSVVVDCSTIGVPAAQKIGAELASYDLDFCDAPVSGGDIGAQRGTLTFMVGGKPETYERILPL
ncbi:MAG: NAD(P)-dependent oxidoreductase, partial [Pseudanabaenaceae cyanobacterium]